MMLVRARTLRTHVGALLVLACLALLSPLSTVAQDRTPTPSAEELWETYPLDPSPTRGAEVSAVASPAGSGSSRRPPDSAPARSDRAIPLPALASRRLRRGAGRDGAPEHPPPARARRAACVSARQRRSDAVSISRGLRRASARLAAFSRGRCSEPERPRVAAGSGRLRPGGPRAARPAPCVDRDDRMAPHRRGVALLRRRAGWRR